MGYRRGIKPDVLAAGGRIVVQRASAGGTTLEIYNRTLPPGQLAASPGANPGDQGSCAVFEGHEQCDRAGQSAPAVCSTTLWTSFVKNPEEEIIDGLPRAVWLKALVAHGAEWGEAGSILARLLRSQDNSRQFKEYVTRLLGYGAVDINRVQECTARRVTALGGGKLRQDASHIHRFPLPLSLSGRRGHRKLIITLSWLSPVNHTTSGLAGGGSLVRPSTRSASSETATSGLAGGSARNPATRDPRR